MSIILEIMIGVLLTLPFIPLVNKLSVQWRDRYLALSLVLAGLIYVGFAMIWGNREWVLIEMVGLLACVIFAVLGLLRSSLFIALGWFMHPVWDVGLHTLVDHEHVPGWYPGVCIGVDWAVAAYAYSKFIESRDVHQQETVGTSDLETQS